MPYKYIKKLGSGTYGRVILVLNEETQELEAIKCIKHDIRNSYQDEILNHMTVCDHDNIIGCNVVFTDKDYLCISMEYAHDGDLFHKLNKTDVFCENLAKVYFLQLIQAVEYCHINGILHRDIKLENLLLHGNILKLTDFGFSCTINQFDTERLFGTAAYLSPEVILKKKNYDYRKVDIWACGVVLYTMVCGHYPFQEKDLIQQLKKIIKLKYTIPEHLSPQCKDLIKKIFEFDPEKRISIVEIYQHSWLNN